MLTDGDGTASGSWISLLSLLAFDLSNPEVLMLLLLTPAERRMPEILLLPSSFKSFFRRAAMWLGSGLGSLLWPFTGSKLCELSSAG